MYGWDSHVAMLFFILIAVLIPLIGFIVYRHTTQKQDTPAFAVFHPGYEFNVQGDGPGKCAYCNIADMNMQYGQDRSKVIWPDYQRLVQHCKEIHPGLEPKWLVGSTPIPTSGSLPQFGVQGVQLQSIVWDIPIGTQLEAEYDGRMVPATVTGDLPVPIPIYHPLA